jgi:hypothetical protein
MAKPPADDLPTFLGQQAQADLVAVLLELAHDHEPVRARLKRMQLADQPSKLASGFKKTLAGWKRSTQFFGYREAAAFGQKLEGWILQVERELGPKDPAAALALFQAFIESDTSWCERADDSNGDIGDAVRLACQHWLRAAARCETPAEGWPHRVFDLYRADKYGARDELLRSASLLLSEDQQRQLVAQLDDQLAALAAPWSSSRGGRAPGLDSPPFEVFKLSGALSLLSESLGDPDVKVRAALHYSPDPNPVQREDFARAYIEADRPGDALKWLHDPWGQMENTRKGLLAQALEGLGRLDDSLPIRQALFEQTLSTFDLDQWLRHLREPARSEAIGHARQKALAHANVAAAAMVLLKIGDPQAAEHKLMTNPLSVDGSAYGHLLPLAKELRAHNCPRGETVIYRALLNAILDRAYARAYGHAARYWARLRDIAHSGVGLAPLSPADTFEAEIRTRHGRKTAFWANVNGSRRDRHDEAADGE